MSSAPAALSTSRADVDQMPLSLVEKGLLAIGIFEVPLQLDKYFGISDADAELGAVAGINVSVTLLAFIGLYVIWFSSRALQLGRARVSLMLGIPMLAYLLMVGISILTAEVRFLAICDWVNVFQAYFLFFYLANRIRSRRDVIFVIGCLAFAMFFQSLLVIGLATLGEGAAGQEFKFGPLVLAVWSDGRPAGTMHSAVLVGSVLSMVWMPIAGLTLAQCSTIVKRVSGLVLAIVLLAILLTQTRGAIFSTGLGSIVLGFAMFSRGWLSRRAIMVAIILALLATVPLANVVRKRVIAGDNDSAGARKHLTAIALETIADQPLFGYGAGNCHLACLAAANASEYRAEWYYTIHCKYLVVWIENGIIGLVAFLCILLNSIRHGWAAWRTRDALLAPIGLALSIAIAGHMIHMLVDIFNARIQVQMLWIVLGLTAAVYRISRASLPPAAPPMIPRTIRGGVGHAS